MTEAATQAGDAREHILDAAHRLLAERGAEDVTMAEIAAEAGVARATVFNHFGSKRALLHSMTAGVLGFYQELLEGGLADEERPTAEIVRHLFVVMGYGIEAERRFHRAVFREIAQLSLGLEEGGPGTAARHRNHETLTALLARGQARGDIARELAPDALARAFASLVTGTITHWLYDDASHPLRERMRDAADIFLSPIAIAPVATPAATPAASPGGDD